MNIGLYFGSFNPIHVGHLIVASLVADETDIDRVWFVVSPQNPFKNKKSLLHEQDRYDLVRTAIADDPRLDVSDIEFRLKRPSYTIDTLTHLQEKYPQHHFEVIVGEDNLTHFGKWKNHKKILEHFGLRVYSRPGCEKTPFHAHEHVHLLDCPVQMKLSATFIRQQIQQGRSIRHLVPLEVENAIRLKGFYKD